MTPCIIHSLVHLYFWCYLKSSITLFQLLIISLQNNGLALITLPHLMCYISSTNICEWCHSNTFTGSLDLQHLCSEWNLISTARIIRRLKPHYGNIARRMEFHLPGPLSEKNLCAALWWTPSRGLYPLYGVHVTDFSEFSRFLPQAACRRLPLDHNASRLWAHLLPLSKTHNYLRADWILRLARLHLCITFLSPCSHLFSSLCLYLPVAHLKPRSSRLGGLQGLLFGYISRGGEWFSHTGPGPAATAASVLRELLPFL